MTLPPPAILFDLDGTLVNTIPLIVGSMQYAFEGRDRVPTTEGWLAQLGTPLPAMMAPYASGPADIAALIARYREHQRANHDLLIRAYDDATDVVREFAERGHPLAVVTSKAVPIARMALDWAGMTPHFQLIVGLESTTVHKPDPAPVRFALEHLGAPAATAWMVGDSPFDLAAGRDAGTRTCGALWGPFSRAQLETERPDALAAGMRELLQIIPASIALTP